MKRKYLAVFILPQPEAEHARIVDVIKDVSDGDFKAAFFGAGGGGFLFTSELKPWDIGFGRIVMNNDSVLIVELGDLFAQQNLKVAENWLTAHQSREK